jgi:hypothetical protein
VKPQQPLHCWRLVEPPPGAVPPEDVVEAVLTRTHATLVYGESCFVVTTAVEGGGLCVLRLEYLGRLAATGSGRPVLIFAGGDSGAEQQVAPCRDALDGSAVWDGGAEALRATLGALLDDAAHAMDVAERSL